MTFKELADKLRTRDQNGVDDFNNSGAAHHIEGRLALVHDRAKDALLGLITLLDMLAAEEERKRGASSDINEAGR